MEPDRAALIEIATEEFTSLLPPGWERPSLDDYREAVAGLISVLEREGILISCPPRALDGSKDNISNPMHTQSMRIVVESKLDQLGDALLRG